MPFRHGQRQQDGGAIECSALGWIVVSWESLGWAGAVEVPEEDEVGGAVLAREDGVSSLL